MAEKICKHILKSKLTIYLLNTFMLSDCVSAELTFPHSSAQNPEASLLLHYPSFNLDSSSVDCDLLYNTELNTFIGDSANSWPSSQQDSGFIFLPVWKLCSQPSYLQPLCTLLYLVSFDSGAWLSSGPPWPLQASFSLWEETEKGLHFASWNSSLI